MSTHSWITLPLDATSRERLAASGLEYRGVEVGSAEFVPFIRAIARGFLDEDPTDEQVEGSRERVIDRRLTGVYDPRAADPAVPVATIDSWETPLSLPGRRTIPMWAISGVTVSPTRRRRGIATAMLEGELRTASAAGYAIAGLTVTEATIYGRFGFAPAVYSTDWSIDTRRARWIGPSGSGRLDAVDRERLLAELAAVHERVRPANPGDVAGWTGLWRRIAGLAPGGEQRKIRGVIHSDDDGTVRGVMAYSIKEGEHDFTRGELTVSLLVADGPDAYRALWRFALEHDLIATVHAPLRSTDEPLRWMIADQRGATVTTREHGWLRILDVPAVLAAREYSAPASLVLRVTDPLGFADGSWRLEVGSDGAAEVGPVKDAAPEVTLSVGDLSAIVLGGVRVSTLAAAGRVQASASALRVLERSFASADTPFLSLWY
ncbi:MAG: GNAT family N-acetyltransferase [Microbacterium pygmaeum]